MKEMLSILEYKCWYFEEAEKRGDAEFYRQLPEEELPVELRVKNFLDKVNTFRTKRAE